MIRCITGYDYRGELDKVDRDSMPASVCLSRQIDLRWPDEVARSRKQVESLCCNVFRLLDWENLSNWQKPVSVLEEQFGCPTAFLSKLVFNKVRRAGLSICFYLFVSFVLLLTHKYFYVLLKQQNLDFESFGLYFEIREKGTLYSAVIRCFHF